MTGDLRVNKMKKLYWSPSTGSRPYEEHLDDDQ